MNSRRGGLFLTYREELGALVPRGERVDGLLHDGEHTVRGAGGAGPGGTGGGQMRTDQGAQTVPGVGGPFPQGTP